MKKKERSKVVKKEKVEDPYKDIPLEFSTQPKGEKNPCKYLRLEETINPIIFTDKKKGKLVVLEKTPCGHELRLLN